MKRWIVLILAIGILGGGGLAAYAWTVQEDSGVSACAEMAKNKGGGSDKLSGERYRRLRTLFNESRDAEIRLHGVALVDLVWQGQGVSDDDTGTMIILAGKVTEAYAGLTGACADHGHILPSLGGNA